MAGKKIGELTPLGRNLIATDELELSLAGSAGSRKITGQEIIDAVGGVTSVDMTTPTGLTVTGAPITGAGTLALDLQSGYSIPTTANQSNWTTAYNDSITSANLSYGGASTNLVLNQQDGGTISTGLIAGAASAGKFVFYNGSNLAYVSLNATTPLSYNNGSNTFSISQSGASTDGYLSSTDWNTFNSKQAALVSGTNIKTINSTSLLGSGDVAVQPTLVSGTNIKTINGSTVLGSGDLVVGGGMRKYVNTTLQTASISPPGETLVGSYLIPANTFVSNGSFEFLIKAGVSGGSSSMQAKLYINTSSTLTGATLIATSTNNSGGGYFNFVRNAILSSNVISLLGSTFQTNLDLVSGSFSQSTVTFDVTANRYFLVSLTPSSGASAEIIGVKFVQYES